MRLSKITIKAIVGYILLIRVSVLAGYIVFEEIKKLSNQKKINQEDRNKIVQTNKILSMVNETENTGRIVIRSDEKEALQTFLEKNVYLQNEVLKFRRDITSEKQLLTLDTTGSLLNLRSNNLQELKAFQESDSTSTIIRSAIRELSSLESYLDYEFFDKKKNAVSGASTSDIASILKKYKGVKVPATFEKIKKSNKIDRVVMETLPLLNKVNEKAQQSKSLINEKMHKLWQNDMQVSKKLDDLLHNFEEEVLINSQKLSQERKTIFENSKNLLILSFLIALGIIAISSIVIISDFMTSQRYRRRLEAANRKPNNLLKNREQLISMASHDLRMPLSSIVGYSELLGKLNITEKGKNYLSHIKFSSEYISRLVDELLDYTRIESGKVVIEKIPSNLPEVIDEVASNVKSAYKNKEVILSFAFSDIMNNLNFSTNTCRAKQILYNLISNAFEFTEQGIVHIEADARLYEDGIYEIGVAVTDTGMGIKEEQQEHIFNEFTQANDEISKFHRGFGLGLHISQKLARLLNGKIYLESEEGKGSIFTLCFLAEKVVERTRTTPVITSDKRAEDINIVVIDDDQSILSLITELLEQKKIGAITFTNGRETLSALEKLQFDLVITDIQLPKMNGFHFITLFNEKYAVASLPVLAITGRRDVPESFYTKSGFSGVLPKPFTPEKFYEKFKVFLPNPNTEVEHKPIMVMPYNSTNGYTPEVLENFMGDDIEGIVGIYKHFLSETEENLQKLEVSTKMQGYTTTKSIAHKTTSMFAQINAQRESEILIVLNKVDKEVPEDLEEKIKNLTHFFKEDCRPIIENYLSSFSGGNL